MSQNYAPQIQPTKTAPLITGQVKIAVTGTAVRLYATSYLLYSGIILTAASTNNASGGTFGLSSITNTVDGTGNGAFIAPGASQSLGNGIDLSSIYVNGTAGDIFYYVGN
jgi:hypothetical protein